METEAESSPLSPAILRGLGDRSYDKRKSAALEVTAVIKSLSENNQKDRISNVINLLAQDFVRSKNIHHRKGGLIGLAASAIGLISDIDRYLHLLIPPVLECFDDPESRVCYYACESLYNISKVARASVLHYFNQIFDGLCKLFAHVDSDVKNGANLLDRLIKDIVTETETFDIEAFIPLLQKHIKRTKPYIRQLLVGWIAVLNAVPDIHMLDYLPEFLEGLFAMISDTNKEIKQAADNVLAEFLKEIKEAEIIEFTSMVKILIQQCHSKDRDTRLLAMIWMTEFILLGGTRLVDMYSGLLASVFYNVSDVDSEIRHYTKNCNMELSLLVRRTTSQSFDLQPILHILLTEMSNEAIPSRLNALHWMYMLHDKDSVEFNKFIHNVLPVLLKTISDNADEVVLLNLQVLARIASDTIQFHRILHALIVLFYEDRGLLETRGALVVRKLCVLLDPRSIYTTLASILQYKQKPTNNEGSLFNSGDISTKNDDTSANGNGEDGGYNYDYEYLSLVVQTLNLILLTAPELHSLRQTLKTSCLSLGSHSSNNNSNNSANYNTNLLLQQKQQQQQLQQREKDKELFSLLFSCWCHNPVAVFSLCLLSQAYDISALLVKKFAEVEITVGFLLQLDKLIQLIESPAFLQLRLQLLEVNSIHHSDLLKSLYGILMLLPQSQAYKVLSERLSAASTLHMHIGFTQSYYHQQQQMQSVYNNSNNTVTSSSSSSVNVSQSPQSTANVSSTNNTTSKTVGGKLNKQQQQVTATFTPAISISSPPPSAAAAIGVPIIPVMDTKSYNDNLLNTFETVQHKHTTIKQMIISSDINTNTVSAPTRSTSSSPTNIYGSGVSSVINNINTTNTAVTGGVANTDNTALTVTDNDNDSSSNNTSHKGLHNSVDSSLL